MWSHHLFVAQIRRLASLYFVGVWFLIFAEVKVLHAPSITESAANSSCWHDSRGFHLYWDLSMRQRSLGSSEMHGISLFYCSLAPSRHRCEVRGRGIVTARHYGHLHALGWSLCVPNHVVVLVSLLRLGITATFHCYGSVLRQRALSWMKLVCAHPGRGALISLVCTPCNTVTMTGSLSIIIPMEINIFTHRSRTFVTFKFYFNNIVILVLKKA